MTLQNDIKCFKPTAVLFMFGMLLQLIPISRILPSSWLAKWHLMMA